MNLFNYLEAKTKDITEIKNLSGYTIIIFDLETSGLIGSQGLKMLTGKKTTGPDGKQHNKYSDKSLHIAEIGAISYTFGSGKRSKFHTYIKAELSDFIKGLISWDDMKENSTKDIRSVLAGFESWLKQFPKKIIVAHNGKNYDFKIMKLIGDKFGRSYLSSTFSDDGNESTILLDTKETVKIRKELRNLPWPKEIKGGKEKDKNTQDALISMFGINNVNAHTAIEDVRALGKYLLRIFKEINRNE